MQKVIDFENSKGKFAFVELENMKPSVSVERNHIDYGLVKHLTEELWSEIVDTREIKLSLDHKPFTQYFDYVGCKETKMNATQSGQSLMQSLGIENGTWVLIKYK